MKLNYHPLVRRRLQMSINKIFISLQRTINNREAHKASKSKIAQDSSELFRFQYLIECYSQANNELDNDFECSIADGLDD